MTVQINRLFKFGFLYSENECRQTTPVNFSELLIQRTCPHLHDHVPLQFYKARLLLLSLELVVSHLLIALTRV